jgi:hypothetical protein
VKLLLIDRLGVVMRGFTIALLAGCLAGSATAWALDPGRWEVRCRSSANDLGRYDIWMDMIDMLTLERSYGTIVSGARLDNGKRVVLINEECVLSEVTDPKTK